MKTLLTIFVLLAQTIVVTATIVISAIDTTHIDSTISLSADTLLLIEIVQPINRNSKKLDETRIPKKEQSKLTELESKQTSDILGGIGDFFTLIGHFFSKSTFGYYKENGQNGHGPYTLFDRASTKSINQQLTSYPPYFQVLPIRQIAHW